MDEELKAAEATAGSQTLSPEEKAAEIAKMEAELDQQFLDEYNALVKKFKRQLAAALQIQRVKPE